MSEFGQYIHEATPDVQPGEQIVCSYFPFEEAENLPRQYKERDFEALRQRVVEDELGILAAEWIPVTFGGRKKMVTERNPTSAQKEFVYLRDGCTCVYCNFAIPDIRYASIDHKKSFYYQGGKTLVSNLALACRPCNVTKGAESEEWYREKLAEGGLAWRNEEYLRQRDRFKNG